MSKIDQTIIVRSMIIDNDGIDTIDLKISVDEYKQAKFTIIDSLLKLGKEKISKIKKEI